MVVAMANEDELNDEEGKQTILNHDGRAKAKAKARDEMRRDRRCAVLTSHNVSPIYASSYVMCVVGLCFAEFIMCKWEPSRPFSFTCYTWKHIVIVSQSTSWRAKKELNRERELKWANKWGFTSDLFLYLALNSFSKRIPLAAIRCCSEKVSRCQISGLMLRLRNSDPSHFWQVFEGSRA